jgi:hypothetical protein
MKNEPTFQFLITNIWYFVFSQHMQEMHKVRSEYILTFIGIMIELFCNEMNYLQIEYHYGLIFY